MINKKERPIIIGFGPAGIFAALELIENGERPLIFERGKRIGERDRDVRGFITKRQLNPESNIQFGEGGAGAYSDGKLFSRKKNSPQANKVLDTFMKFGAPANIGHMSKPHLGTDVLCQIVVRMREYILENGGEIFYNSKMTDVLVSNGIAQGVVINNDKEYHSRAIYLAIGHSARDTFQMLGQRGLALEQRPICVGVRVEHPVKTINRIRYGDQYQESSDEQAANYSFTYTDREIGRGVYSFCMCPGGEIVNASSHPGRLVLNGMSYAGRSSAFSNSAIVVTAHTSDYSSSDPLAGVEFQKKIEERAFNAAGGSWSAPGQNLLDFLSGKVSRSLNDNSFKMGVVAAEMGDIFPGFVCEMLLSAFHKWQEQYPLFVSDQAVLLAAETRTSCPVKITRGKGYGSVTIKNLFPIGEGSGYAGGITSSAIDAIKAVRTQMQK